MLGKRAITADAALRLPRAFGMSEQLWIGPQADYDLEQVRQQISRDLAQIHTLAV